MAGYAIPSHLTFCLHRAQPVFLDLREDRYFGLDAATKAAFERLLKHEACPEDIDRLLRNGLIETQPAPAAIAPAQAEPPQRSLIGVGAEARPRFRDVAEVTGRLLSAARRRRRGALEPALNLLQRHMPPTASPVDALGPFVARFRAARAWAPVARNCLVDSLALASFLAARRLAAELVIGVKLDPFAAHCWMQRGDTLLNDDVDSVAVFTPILVLG